MVCGSTTLVILGLSCWICEFLVKFFAICVFVNLGLPYFGVCEFGSSLFSGRSRAGSGIDGTYAGQGRVTHDPVSIRPVAIPIYVVSVM